MRGARAVRQSIEPKAPARTRQTLSLACALVSALVFTNARATHASESITTGGVRFAPYSEYAVATALSDDKLVLLRLGTTWCHWCHVMDDETWSQERVADVVHAAFVSFTADADREPALFARFEPWGWPATIVLAKGGVVVLAVKGHRAPDALLALLNPLVDAHQKGAALNAVVREAAATAPLEGDLSIARARVRAHIDALYDDTGHGWGGPKKSVLAPVVVHALVRGAREGDAVSTARATRTLEKTMLLADPVWGGFFQYSTHQVWTKPHTEKLAFSQAAAIRMFVDGHRATGRQDFLDVARGVHGYLRTFTRQPSGAFGANQDADPPKTTAPPLGGPAYYALDDTARRRVGIPRVDASVYASHNGVLIAALASLAGVTGEQAILDDGVRAYESVRATHQDPSGLYRHAASDTDGARALVDQVAMLEGALSLLETTGDSRFLADAIALAEQVRTRFSLGARGFSVTETRAVSALGAFVPFDENVRLGRAFFRLALLDGVAAASTYRALATDIVRALAHPETLTREGRRVGDLALLVDELLDEPVHIAVVGLPSPARDVLARAAHRANAPGRVVEILLPNDRFPDLEKPVLFVCGSTFCSRPLATEDELSRVLPDFVVVKR